MVSLAFATTTIGGHSTDNLAAIAAVVLGGTSLFGGIGTVLGTVVGVFIGHPQNGFVILGVQPFWQQVAVGAVLIVAVYIDQLKRRAQERGEGVGTMRRRWLVGTVALALLLAACGGNDEGGGGGGGEQQYKLTLIQGVKGDQFYVTMQCGAQEAATAAGATLEVTAPDEFDASLQTPVVNAVVAKKPDAILVAPTDTQAMIPPLTQAKAAGIKLVFVDTTTENGAELAESEIASDNEEGGREAARSLAELTGGKGSVAVINVKPASPPTPGPRASRRRSRRRPGSSTSGLSTPTTSRRSPRPRRPPCWPPTPTWWASSRPTCSRPRGGDRAPQRRRHREGQDRRLRRRAQAGRGPGQGIVQALIAQKPADIGKAGVEQAVAALKGEPVQKKIGTGFVVVTKENMKDPDVEPFLYKSSC